jgi:hypothetical protein
MSVIFAGICTCRGNRAKKNALPAGAAQRVSPAALAGGAMID